MSRKDFVFKNDVPIHDILLDTENARIRTGSDQRNCISRILRKEKQMLVLIEDIAKNGLTTMPILIMPTQNNKWIVKDGNRRITALKLLNAPEICPEPQLISKIMNIAEKYKDNISPYVDCLCSENPKAIFDEIVARHSGAREGAGQYDWFAYMRTIYLLNNGHPTDYKRAGQYMSWAEKEGVDVEDDFPISTTARFFNKENLKLLGFDIENDQLKPILSKEKILKMASMINDDFSSKKVDVNDVFKPEHALLYIKKLREKSGLYDIDQIEDIQNNNTDPNPRSTKEPDHSENSSNNKTTRGYTPKKIPAERNRLFGRAKIGISVPDDATKVRMIITELRQLDIRKTTLAATVLLRALLELSDREYRTIHSIKDKGGLSKNIALAADHMLNNGKISSSEHNIIMAYTRGEQGVLHIETLQKFLHKESHHPDYQTINIFWDNIGCFVRACWKD
ncbi:MULTISPECIES: ParB N-terminal domain-containing protein [Klebsiella]|uniref:ParB N-terminal domain-containing protein n=1 Tax=Klebsiella TaxID=570 RepID=UPI000501ECF8|nr:MULTISPECIES: ParB N-terminal domain-containing protein [Klebsiella]KGB01835.1 parB-like nuclease domain protein [Klebsiella aerogenes]MBZ7651346.1 hypothetical protein [Klebsiella grimontii]HDU4714787.1 hypothetical protein [Klebsiella aerogenes]